MQRTCWWREERAEQGTRGQPSGPPRAATLSVLGRRALGARHVRLALWAAAADGPADRLLTARQNRQNRPDRARIWDPRTRIGEWGELWAALLTCGLSATSGKGTRVPAVHEPYKIDDISQPWRTGDKTAGQQSAGW